MWKIFSDWKFSPWLFAIVLLACFAVSAGIRFEQFEVWGKTPVVYFVGERPMMTTLDAPIWLRIAREYNEETYGEKQLRNYPHKLSPKTLAESQIPQKFTDSPTSLLSKEKPEKKYHEIPLLSYIIAHLAPFFNQNYYLTGTMLIPVLASLFILPLGIYFFLIGIPISGFLGGLIGTFSSGYYMRSSIGRIDTDMLNLFFPFLVSLMILLALRSKTERFALFYSACAGLSIFLFDWWYGKPGFSLVYFSVLVFCLFIQKIRFTTILKCSLIFLLFTHPKTFLSATGNIDYFLKGYILTEEDTSTSSIDGATTPASFPNTMTTISEADRVSFEEVFQRILSKKYFVWAGFLAFCVLTFLRWRVLLPLVPVLFLGLLSFHSSNRFIMYLGPFIGVGLGWLLSLGIESLFFILPQKSVDGKEKNKLFAKNKEAKSFKVSKSHKPLVSEGSEIKELSVFDSLKCLRSQGGMTNLVRQITLYLSMGAFFWLVSSQTAISFVPAPSIHTGLYKTFFEVKKVVPEDSVLLTWWDYGYAINDATGLSTFHDGGSQMSPKTYFIARSLISTDQDELHDITQYLATESNLGIAKNNTSPEALLEAVRNPTQKPWKPIYLFFTADMTGKYGAISKLGSWDIEKGGSKPRFYQNLACNKFTNQEMSCRGAKIDLKAGFINSQLALRRLIFIRNGQVMQEKKFGHAQGFTLQLILAGKNIVEVQLIDEAVFLSNYNQMYLLGRYRTDLFEESYNAFPFARLFKFKF